MEELKPYKTQGNLISGRAMAERVSLSALKNLMEDLSQEVFGRPETKEIHGSGVRMKIREGIMTIRDHLGDRAEIKGLLTKVSAKIYPLITPKEFTGMSLETLLKAIDDDRAIAVLDGRDIQAIAAFEEIGQGADGRKVVEIKKVVVNKSHQGKGLGKRVFEEALRKAKDANPQGTLFILATNNGRMESLAKSQGFEQVTGGTWNRLWQGVKELSDEDLKRVKHHQDTFRLKEFMLDPLKTKG